jgi:hypothetical protein
MAQAPTFSVVSRSRPQRSIWAGVPPFMMVPAARPTLTPIEVTMPGQWWQSSMIGIRVMAAAPPSPARSARSSADSVVPDALRSSCFLKRSRAIWSMPKAA